MQDIILTEKQSAVFTNKARTVLAGGSAGGGKAVSLPTKIPTPNGWTTMGELKVGDVVFDENGKPCNVIAATEVMFGRPCYEVVFSDGTVIQCDEQHEWVTMTGKERIAFVTRTPEWRAARRDKRPSRSKGTASPAQLAVLLERNKNMEHDYLEPPRGTPRTTLEILETLKFRGERHNHSVDVCKPVEYPKKDLPVDPWLLGQWLGDGDTSGGAVTTADEHNFQRLVESGYEVKNIGKYRYRLYGLAKDLRAAGVFNNKHIPKEYLQSSVEDRIELLHGLMDSDGYASTEGKCVFYNTNKVLIDGFLELAKSLGINCTFTEDRAKLYGKDCGPAYNVYLNATFPIFSLPRRKDRQKISKEQYRRRQIVDVRKIDSVPVRCIQVDSPRNMFLCSESFIPTHNSMLIRATAIQFCMLIPGLTFYIFRSSAPQLRSTFFEGGASFPAMLSDMIAAGFVKINYNELTIKFTYNDSQIKLRHMARISDADDIQGVELAAVAVDEGSIMPEILLRWMVGRRRLGSLVVPDVVLVDNPDPSKRIMLADKMPFMLITSNPGNVSGSFLKRWFIDPAPPMKEFVSDPDFGGDRTIYIPFGMKDNPHLDADYEKTLLAIGDPVKIRQMRDGDWEASSDTLMGYAFKRSKNVCKTIQKNDFDKFDIIRCFDYGFSSPAACAWIGTLKEGHELEMTFGDKKFFPRGTKVVLREWQVAKHDKPDEGLRYSEKELADGILSKEDSWGLRGKVKIGPGDVYDRKTGENSIGDEMAKHGVKFTMPWKSKNSRSIGWSRMCTMMLEAHKDVVERPALLFGEDCLHAIRTIPALPPDPNNPDDCVTDGVDDHMPDAIRYGISDSKKQAGRVATKGL